MSLCNSYQADFGVTPLKGRALLSPSNIGTDAVETFLPAIKDSVVQKLLTLDPAHTITKHLQQSIESDHFWLKKNKPKVGGF